ncbi:hypothetical protein H6F43_14885 [Leptolyngbya sp. FACHB-36]|uniref:HpsJ family protein n=1 Tax=Leptolyngbya sp. FACHB-36 TaxID=2692808 RepID=UPI00168048F0|nr:HpsJ family protein [Leptolyngbya sp. FACHB-36]MBD2021463.1 hypothetical protein [Leptolyngbya sp. FACHB-36]
MKSPTVPPVAAFVLKVVGVVLILLYLLDIAVLLSAAKFQDSQWMLTFTTQLVDRGFVPLIGFALLFTGIWVDSATSEQEGSSQGLKLAALLLASLLGAMFLAFIPLNIGAANSASAAEVKRVADEASRAEKDLDAQVQQQLDQQLGFIDQAIKSGQVQGDQLAQAQQQQERLRKLKSDPKALEAQIGPQRNQKLTEIRNRRQEVESQIRSNSTRVGMRISLGSLLLASAYALIGWTGLRRSLRS